MTRSTGWRVGAEPSGLWNAKTFSSQLGLGIQLHPSSRRAGRRSQGRARPVARPWRGLGGLEFLEAVEREHGAVRCDGAARITVAVACELDAERGVHLGLLSRGRAGQRHGETGRILD